MGRGQRAVWWWPLLFVFVWLASGCGRLPPGDATLQPADASQAAPWQVAEHVARQGDGTARVLTGPALSDGRSSTALELAAAEDGDLTYWRAADGPALDVDVRLRFLSMAGRGRIVLTAYDQAGQPVGVVGWLFSGRAPLVAAPSYWLDMRPAENFHGGWFALHAPVRTLLAQYLPFLEPRQVARCVLAVQAGAGQHVLITAAGLSPDAAAAVRFTAAGPPAPLAVGDVFTISGVVENVTAAPVPAVTVTLVEPYGAGVAVLNGASRDVTALAPGERRPVTWRVQAARPESVNLSQPWAVTFAIDEQDAGTAVPVSVYDPAPGTIYYVMTEDLEPIDSAGYGKAWGNGNGWLDPEEFAVQMVQKPQALNDIADKYGAKWTHYIAWTAVEGAHWAAARSPTGAWPAVIADIRAAVRHGAAAGHEYAPHMHSDYDPRLPGNVLSYDPATDGFWGDHRRHGWAHSLPEEGDYGDAASRTGSLFYYLRELALLTTDTQGQILDARAGSFDFGHGDAAASVRAYRRLGLWGSSDADGNAGGMTARAYGRNLYFTRPDDINQPAADVHDLGLVEITPTPRDCIQYNRQTAAAMNTRAHAGVDAFTREGRVLPGVHAIVGFTHAMFMRGEPDWRSVTGGQFAALDAHLAHMRAYADQGLLRFATATELVAAYLDYYTPELLAVYGPRQEKGWGVSDYPLTLLGRGIVADAAHPRTVRVAYPPYLRFTAYRAEILKNGVVIYQTWGLPTPNNDLAFTVDDRAAQYTLRLYHNRAVWKMATWWRWLRSHIS